MSQEIGFFYGSTTGMTEDVAYRIEACIKEKFGLGDQIGYPEYYLDAMGMLAEQLGAQGATFVGEWPSADYKFASSKALKANGNFIGLALDEDSQPEKTQERLEAWVAQVIPLLLA